MSAKLSSHKYLVYFDTSEMEAVMGIASATEEWPTFHFRKWEAGRELSKTLSEKFKVMLSDKNVKSEEISGVVVFVGPGSFTGLRIGISFANALAFALSVPIYETRKKEEVDLSKPKKIALPFYDSDPKITTPKKR